MYLILLQLMPAPLQLRYLLSVAAVLFFGFFAPPASVAQSQFSGYISTYTGYTTSPPHELIAGRNRLRLNFRNTFSGGRIYASADLRHLFAESGDSLDFRLRELFMDIFFDDADLRIGKQPIAWGKTEGDFIFDLVSPFDLSEFLTQDFRELREGVTAVNLTWYFGRNQIQFVVNPAFEASRLPDYEGHWGIVPADIFPVPASFETYRPERVRLADMQFAARYSLRSAASFDLDIAAMYWRSSTPGYFKDFSIINIGDIRLPLNVTFRETYKPGFITGVWGEFRPLTDLRFPFEAAFFQYRPYDVLPGPLTSRDLKRFGQLTDSLNQNDFPELLELLERFNTTLAQGSDSGFLSYRPAVKWMAGVQYPLLNWRSSVQYVADIALDHDSDVLQERWFHGLTVSTNRSFFRDQLLVRMLGRYQFNGGDYWINPELSWDLRDGLSITGGAHLFGGPRPDIDYTHLSFRRYGANSLVYLSAAWFW